ncbi:hypothetical protein ACFQ3Z_16330 [Streptomyces nogalater]
MNRHGGRVVEVDAHTVIPDLIDLLDAANARVRGMRAVVVELDTPDGPVPAAALRSAVGLAERSDFVKLWGLALEAVHGKPTTIDEVIAWSKVPLEDRFDQAYPGVQLHSNKGYESESTLYARGWSAVVQLARLLRAAITAWPEPNWPTQVRRETFLRNAVAAWSEGRVDDLRALIAEYDQDAGA